MSYPDCYQVLGVPRDASHDQIKKSYRQLALQYHPDRNKANDAEERFKEIGIAYNVLSNPKSKLMYDTQRMSSEFDFNEFIEKTADALEDISKIILDFVVEKNKQQQQNKNQTQPIKKNRRNRPRKTVKTPK